MKFPVLIAISLPYNKWIHFLSLLTSELSSISSTIKVPLWTISHRAPISLISSNVFPKASATKIHNIGLHLFPPLSNKSQTGSFKLLLRDDISFYYFVYSKLFVHYDNYYSVDKTLGIISVKAPQSLNYLL